MKEMIYYDDGKSIHACESGYAGVRRASPLLVWTLCEIDVPANEGYRKEGGEMVTCRDCLEKRAENGQFGVGA